MNIKILREDLLPALSFVSGVVEKRQTLPILANLYFDLVDGHLTVVGTDLEVEMSYQVEGVSGTDGIFTISRKILDITSRLPENSTISLKRADDNIVVSCARNRYTLKTLKGDDFPRIKADNWEERFNIKQSSLKKLLDRTSFAMAEQDVRYYLNGVLLEIEDKNLRAVATDGHRLAQSDVDIEQSVNAVKQIIVPRKAVLELRRFLEDDEAAITLEVSKNHLKLTRANTTLITKLIDGKFPEFKDVLKTEPGIIVPVERSILLDTLDRVAVLTSDRFRGVKISMGGGVMWVTTTNPEQQEEAVEELEIAYSGEEVQTGYNIKYLIDAVRVCGGDRIEMHLQGNDGICIIKQPEDERSIWLIMPMRI